MSNGDKIISRDELKDKNKNRSGRKKIEFRGIYVDAEMKPIDSIIPYDKNPKTHPPEQVAKIANSIKQFSWDQPIVVDENNVIIKGHGRYLAAKSLGIIEVPVIVRTDMSDAEVRASRIADNQTAQSYWHIGNLLREMETLHGLDAPLESTGYSLDEIRTLYPGLLETEEDFTLHGDTESDTPSELLSKGPDGLVGKALPKNRKGASSLTDWINIHNNIIVPFSGDRTGLAALCWCLSSDVDMEKVTIVDTFFGQRLWRWHDNYLSYIENSLNITIKRSRNRLDEWFSLIKEIGWPSKQKPWCCSRLRGEAIQTQYEEDPINSVVILGNPVGDDGTQIYRQRGIIVETSVDYAAPFYKQSDSALTAVIENTGVKLNPLYQVTDLYLCPGCPRYSRPDFAFLKNHDLDLWIRWMVYFGKSQWNREYKESDEFDAVALEMIADNIEPREYGRYRMYAADLPDCPQPVREEIRKGDNYGWSKSDDAKLDPEGRLDAPRGEWWKDVGTSDAYKKMEKEMEEYWKNRRDTPIDDWLSDRIKEAKQIVTNSDPEGSNDE